MKSHKTQHIKLSRDRSKINSSEAGASGTCCIILISQWCCSLACARNERFRLFSPRSVPAYAPEHERIHSNFFVTKETVLHLFLYVYGGAYLHNRRSSRQQQQSDSYSRRDHKAYKREHDLTFKKVTLSFVDAGRGEKEKIRRLSPTQLERDQI